jgi:hypothetical protein
MHKSWSTAEQVGVTAVEAAVAVDVDGKFAVTSPVSALLDAVLDSVDVELELALGWVDSRVELVLGPRSLLDDITGLTIETLGSCKGIEGTTGITLPGGENIFLNTKFVWALTK